MLAVSCAALLMAFTFAPQTPAEHADEDDPIQIDLMYPWLARPVGDCKAAIAKRDFRFVVLDRNAEWIPGFEAQRLSTQSVKTRVIRRPSPPHNRSAEFSFELRAKVYASRYNRTLFSYLKRTGQRRGASR